MQRKTGYFFIVTLLAALVLGCGSSSDDQQISGQQGNGQVPQTTGFRVFLTNANLAALFPAVAAPQANDLVNPAITSYTVFVYDANGNLITQASAPRTPGGNLDLLLTGLQLGGFDVVVAGLDANGGLVGAARAQNVVTVPNQLVQIAAEVFAPFQGFVLPGGNSTTTGTATTGTTTGGTSTGGSTGGTTGGSSTGGTAGNLNMMVSVNLVGGVYEVTWDGGATGTGPVQVVSAGRLDVVNGLADGSIQPTDPLVQQQIFGISALATQDSIAQPARLTTNQTLSGAIITPGFTGFDGSVYRVSVSRTNGDTGFVDIALSAQ